MHQIPRNFRGIVRTPPPPPPWPIGLKQLETKDMLFVQLAEDGGEDTKYMEMLNSVENYTTYLPENCKLKHLADERDSLSLVTLSGGSRLIDINDYEILIPKKLKPKMIFILHLHTAGM